jgi:hypothetical protein
MPATAPLFYGFYSPCQDEDPLRLLPLVYPTHCLEVGVGEGEGVPAKSQT